MGYTPITTGNQPNDGLGEGGRSGGEKINSMFREIYEHTYINADGVRVTRMASDPAIQDLTSFRVDDVCERWVDPLTRQRYVKGIVKDDTFIFPDDIDDNAKFFLLIDKEQITV